MSKIIISDAAINALVAELRTTRLDIETKINQLLIRDHALVEDAQIDTLSLMIKDLDNECCNSNII